jgi:predicted nucleotidyltransferase
MDRETVIRTLRAHEAELRAEGISHVYLFGSVARGEEDEKSDVDLFYDCEPECFGFLQFMGIRERVPGYSVCRSTSCPETASIVVSALRSKRRRFRSFDASASSLPPAARTAR